jgi:UDP-N-acetylglucosamine transferase subunit ALG13
MIFFTVGTEQFDFDRMVDAADRVAVALPQEEVFIQIGTNRRCPNRAKWERWLPYEAFVQRVEDARIVVTHAGAGSLLSCAWRSKVAVAMPRRQDYGEHVDNHQVEFAQRMAAMGHALIAETPEELCALVLNYEPSLGRSNGTSVSAPPLVESLKQWLAEGA